MEVGDLGVKIRSSVWDMLDLSIWGCWFGSWIYKSEVLG